jgi:hypothetical protein
MHIRMLNMIIYKRSGDNFITSEKYDPNDYTPQFCYFCEFAPF